MKPDNCSHIELRKECHTAIKKWCKEESERTGEFISIKTIVGRLIKNFIKKQQQKGK